jgi:hypothetical protein
MSEAEVVVNWWITKEAVAFVGIVAQAIAIIWVCIDWKLSQYQHSDWRKAHRQSETKTICNIEGLWSRFGGPASSPKINWLLVDSAELEDLVKEFPERSDDDVLKSRKIEALTPRFGIGPSDDDLIRLRGQIAHLALLRRGVPEYRAFVRRRAFQKAVMVMMAGFLLQAFGSWPAKWIETSIPAVTASQEPK